MFEQEVTRGIVLLDENFKQWREKINLDHLDMSRSDGCIFGQIYDGGYQEGLDHLFSCTASEEERFQFAVFHGFNVSLNDDTHNVGWRCELLRDAWIAALQVEEFEDVPSDEANNE